MIRREELEELFADKVCKWEGDNAFQGLLILAKYVDITKKYLLTNAGHDIVYSIGIDEALELNISREDWEALARLNWMLDEENDSLAVFV